MKSSATLVAGIDLGTTNSALAYAALPTARETPSVTPFEIPQLVRAADFRPWPLLPSSLFLPGDADFPPGATALPWDENPAWVVGELARARGSEIPSRLVVSAKSWLSHSAVDRTSALLPLEAPDGIARVSPVEASRRYLEHLRHAWDHVNPDTPLEAQHVLVTVPASFDAVARDLTLRAASEAGFGDVVLLEEPQAAFYAWLERHADWRERVSPGDLVLVVDVGGGTTDFSLIAITAEDGELTLERVAVGDHILLGGDNMDLALAHGVAQSLGRKLSSSQMHALWQSARAAKEGLFANPDRADHPVTILGKGSGVVGGAIKAKLERAVLESTVLDGFFPQAPAGAEPEDPRSSGINEIGLPYAADAAVTRHLARFLRQAGPGNNRGGKMAAPTHVLFNGGVFLAPALRQRLLGVLNGWLGEHKLPAAKALEGDDLMHAVSRGAAYYGLARAGHGIRIRGGVARSYYIGIKPAMPAIPGVKPPLRALTVAQAGMEEGTRIQPGRREFALRVGQQCDFRFFSSVERHADQPGEMLEEIGGDMEELAPIEVTLPGAEAESVPVTLETEITETGMLQLWCVARDGRRWKLEFNVREKVGG
ncbi:MAG: Hsp70 family protein [Bryobacteraceae bacterium]